MLTFDRTICGDLHEATGREWLETNGLGGYASSTIAGMNTRRYHGLLVASLQPPVERYVLLSKLEETLIVKGERYALSVNRYAGAVHPQGHQYLTGFRLDPFPLFTYEVAGVTLEKRLCLVQGENTLVVQYKLKGTDCQLEILPLIAFRDYHSLTHENDALQAAVEETPGLVSVMPYPNLPRLYLAHNADELAQTGHWYRQFEYEAEAARGLDAHEDLFNPLCLTFSLSARRTASLIVSTRAYQAKRAATLLRQQINLQNQIPANHEDNSLSDGSYINLLKQAANQFIVTRGDHKTVIAGYHWFCDWGRDTMIALPGLTLVTGRFELARDILLEFAKHIDRGMLPNRFPDRGEEPEYNTVDATLWFIEAIRAYLAYTDDESFVRQHLYQTLKDIVSWHIQGTRYQIQVQEDGLLHAGEAGVQLTWMDAKVGDWVVTPRIGKPVEIQALWYNALCVMTELAERFGETEHAAEFRARATLARHSFQQQFWNEAAGCLFDVVNGVARDGSIRPNQIFAASLPHTMLDETQAQHVVAAVERELLTPYGLRSLSPKDAQYRGRYEGGIVNRDGAYHQGTVWAWLLGPFITAYVKAHGRSAASQTQARQWLKAFSAHLGDAGLGQVSEIFDGDAPHAPRGCIAQAWSVAELLRATIEDAQ